MERQRSKIGESTSGDGISLLRIPGPISDDITKEILLRLPVKSLARFLCVSKKWESTIRSRDFVKSFLTQSSKRPSLLFTLWHYRGATFFSFAPSRSSSHPRNPGGDGSPLVVNLQVTFYGYRHVPLRSVGGLICISLRNKFVIYNPTTRRSMKLPKIESEENGIRNPCFLGYDPIEGQYKVLSLVKPVRVFTLGDGEWRTIGSSPLHFRGWFWKCINGIVYYVAKSDDDEDKGIVSFDVRFEKFGFIKLPRVCSVSSLLNYMGKLAVACYHMDEICRQTGAKVGGIDLWVLENAKTQEWSRKLFVWPSSWRDVVGNIQKPLSMCMVAANGGEIILAPSCLCDPFFILCYDPRTNSLRRTEVEGIEHDEIPQTGKWNRNPISTFSDHVESIMFL